MKKFPAIILIPSLLSCSSTKKTSATQSSSMRATSHTVTTPDTLSIILPSHSLERTLVSGDSVSTLSCPTATSTATINHDGTLTHTLKTNNNPMSVPILTTTTTTDTTITTNSGTSHDTSSTSPFSHAAWPLCLAVLLIVIIMKCR